MRQKTRSMTRLPRRRLCFAFYCSYYFTSSDGTALLLIFRSCLLTIRYKLELVKEWAPPGASPGALPAITWTAGKGRVDVFTDICVIEVEQYLGLLRATVF